MNTAETVNIMNKNIGKQTTAAILNYIDEFKEDKISVLQAEMKNEFYLQDKKTVAGFVKVESKISSLKAEMQLKFSQQDKKMHVGFANMDTKFAHIDTKFEQIQSQIHKEIRNLTRWFITSIFGIAGFTLAAAKLI